MKILVGYDGSKMAEDALKRASEQALVLDAKVYVVTSMLRADNSQINEVTEAEESLEYVKSIVQAKGIPCETHLLIRGLSPGEDIVAFAREYHVDEIVVGIRKRSKVGKLLMGSTAQYVILNAPCPVLSLK